MLTRKKHLAYHAIGLTAACATLAVIAPVLAPEMIGGSVVALTALSAKHLAGWLAGGWMATWSRTVVMVLAALLLSGAMTAAGAPTLAVPMLIWALIVFWPIRWPLRGSKGGLLA